MDVGNTFYMVKFDEEEDKNKVINVGPWRIYDHCLPISLWFPTFNGVDKDSKFESRGVLRWKSSMDFSINHNF